MKHLTRIYHCLAVVVSVLALVTCAMGQVEPKQASGLGRDVTILVTARAQDDRTRALADKLRPEDFAVTEDKRPQRIIDVKKGSDAPIILAVLIQDDLVSRVSNEIRGIRDFIRRLPEGSRVMTAYITAGSLRITQEFTSDRERAARSLRIVVGSKAASSFNPYVEVVEAFPHFESQPAGRRMLLLVSDGLDLSRGLVEANPAQSVDLDHAIYESQRQGVSVFAMYAPSVGATRRSHLAAMFGQGSLSRLADETGGEAFFSGLDFVTFDPYFREYNQLLDRQWLITYRSTSMEPGFKKIEVKTDYDLKLRHPAGYRLRDKDLETP